MSARDKASPSRSGNTHSPQGPHAHFPDSRPRHAGELLRAARTCRDAQARRGCGRTRPARCWTPRRWPKPRKAARSSCPTARRPGPPSSSRWRRIAAHSCASRSIIRNIDVDAASAQGVLVTRATPGFMASVSEMAIGMMIDCGRKITDQVIDYRNGLDPEPRRGVQLHGATVGIMGYGAIARHLAPICGALGMTVLVSDPYAMVEDAHIKAGRARRAARQIRLRNLPGHRQRGDRESDERHELRAHEEERLFPQTSRVAISTTRPRCSPRWRRSRSPAPRWKSAALSTRSRRSIWQVAPT